MATKKTFRLTLETQNFFAKENSSVWQLSQTDWRRRAPPATVGPRSPCSKQGCQIFLGTTYQNGKNLLDKHKSYQNGHKICRPNGHKIYETAFNITNILHCKTPPKFTQIGIFGSKNMPSGNPAPK
jgi:hypothetical protein